MADWNDQRATRQGFGTTPSQTGDVTATTMDAGLRAHMLKIYNYMASGVLLTGIVALLFYGSPFFETLFNVQYAANGAVTSFSPSMLGWIVMIAPLGFVLAMSFGRNKFSTAALQAMFWGYAATMGLSLSYILALFTGESIAATFFATAGAFAGLSLFGYTTKKDISAWGAFLIMGVVGLIIASLLNAFLIGSPGLELAISGIGVLIFAGLTAYDTQRLKHEYLYVRQAQTTNPGMAAEFPLGKMAILGALNLYLDFINMFLFMLRFLGVARGE